MLKHTVFCTTSIVKRRIRYTPSLFYMQYYCINTHLCSAFVPFMSHMLPESEPKPHKTTDRLQLGLTTLNEYVPHSHTFNTIPYRIYINTNELMSIPFVMQNGFQGATIHVAHFINRFCFLHPPTTTITSILIDLNTCTYVCSAIN